MNKCIYCGKGEEDGITKNIALYHIELVLILMDILTLVIF
jgi:hypothetical protein